MEHKGHFIVPSTDGHRVSSVRYTLWRKGGIEAYTSADNPSVWAQPDAKLLS